MSSYSYNRNCEIIGDGVHLNCLVLMTPTFVGGFYLFGGGHND